MRLFASISRHHQQWHTGGTEFAFYSERLINRHSVLIFRHRHRAAAAYIYPRRFYIHGDVVDELIIDQSAKAGK
jgi:predicted oxidoreductase